MIQTIDIRGENGHAAKTVYNTVSNAVCTHTDWSVDLVSTLESPEIVPNGENGTGLTLEMSTLVDKLIRDGRFPFYIKKQLDGYFGESTGSANVTSVRIEKGWNLTETVGHLAKTGQLKDAKEIVEATRDEKDPSAETIVAYAIAQYAKGWLAEQIIAEQAEDWAVKGSVSQDQGGIDFHLDTDKWDVPYRQTQVGSITRWNSKQKQMKNSDRTELMYQWDHEGHLHVGQHEEIMMANKKIAESAGLNQTLTKRSSGDLKINRQLGTEENPRSFRYLWW